VPERVVLRLVGAAAAELIEDDDAIAVVGEEAVAVAHIVAGAAGAAVKTKQDLLALAKGIDSNAAARDADADEFIGLSIARHCFPLWRCLLCLTRNEWRDRATGAQCAESRRATRAYRPRAAPRRCLRSSRIRRGGPGA